MPRSNRIHKVSQIKYLCKTSRINNSHIASCSDTTYTLAFFRLKGIDSIASGIAGTTTNFIPPRFVPCLVSGLAYYIAMKRPEVANRVNALKQEYEFQFELAQERTKQRP